MQKSGFCIATGKCVANAYRGAAEGAAKIGTFLAKAVRAAMENFNGRSNQPAEDGLPAERPPAPEKSPGQVAAVFTNAMRQFQDPDPVVRAAAMRVFERLGKAESVAQATALLADPDPAVIAQAREVLRALNPETGQGPGPETPQ
ncbi:MAG: HEAT repeat domain-containing protein [Elusimicrobiota bacterium]|nr:HEAT repeat domain-containing protein [Elusimicrobiota bacterium]